MLKQKPKMFSRGQVKANVVLAIGSIGPMLYGANVGVTTGNQFLVGVSIFGVVCLVTAAVLGIRLLKKGPRSA